MISTVFRGTWQTKLLRQVNPIPILLGLVLLACPVSSAESPKASERGGNDLLATISGVSSGPRSDNMIEGSQFIAKMVKAAEALDDYRFTYAMTVYKGKQQETESGRFWFKKPRWLKIVVDHGHSEGAVAVLKPDGKVWAKPPKGMGAAIVHMISPRGVPLSQDSHFLKSINGYPMVKSDFVSLAQALSEFLTQGVTSKVSAKPVNVPGRSKSVYILEMYQSGVLWKRVYVDPENTLPTEWFDNQNGKLYTYSVWRDFKQNTGLSESDFALSKPDN